MHVKSLKVFCDVVGRRSFSRAADENGISQSGVSQIVNHLEQHLGVKLIDRSKRPFVLTPAGEVYYDGCRKLVQKFDALEEKVRSLHQQVAGRVSVASIYSVGMSYMSWFVQDFGERYPQAQIQLEYHHPQRIHELVKDDRVDIGLVSYPKSSRTVEVLPWRDEPMVLVTAPDHSLATQPLPPTATDLADHPMVGFDTELMIRQKIDRAFSALGVELQVAMAFDNIETLKRAIQIGTGFSLLPAPTVADEVTAGSLAARPLADLEMSRPLGIIRRRGHDWGETAQRFVEDLQAAEHSTAAPPQHSSNNGGTAGTRSRDS